MRPLFLATVGMLSLLCTACASHRVASGSVRAGAAAKPAAPAAASTGADEYHPGELFGITEIDGTASDKHSDLASKTPDGGKSDAAKPPAAGTPAATDATVADADKAAKDKAAADKAAADGNLDAGILDAAGNGAATGSEAKPIDGSDPSIGRPSSAPSRKLT